MSSTQFLDRINRRLLAELHTDPRMGIAELARRVEMSAPAVSERVQRLIEAGVITGFRVEIDPAALGLPVAAFVRVRPTAGQLARIIAVAESLPQVSECHRITGEDCVLIKVHAADIGDLEYTLDQFLLYGQTVTSIVVSTLCRHARYPCRRPPGPRGRRRDDAAPVTARSEATGARNRSERRIGWGSRCQRFSRVCE
jgi:Lrp/AsnC family transcriptional regulator, leucine-responsive regulatory protein